MAAQRPAVLIYQEFAALSTTPAIPQLPSLIGGPCYWVQDYPEDKANIQISSKYGTLQAANPYTAPVANVTTITLTDAPNNKVGAVLDSTSVVLTLGAPRVEIAKYGVGGLAATGTTATSSAVLTIGSGSFVTAGVQAGDTCVLTDGSANKLVMTVRSVLALSLTFTSEIPAGAFTPGASTTYRVERTLADTTVSGYVAVSGNTISIKGGMQISVAGTLYTVNYASIYVGYRALRTDLAKINTLDGPLDIVGTLGKIDARNPLAVGASAAFANTNTALQFFGISSDDSAGYLAMRQAVSSRKDTYAIALLTNDLTVITSFGLEATNLADPTYVVSQGISQKFRCVMAGGIALPTTTLLTQDAATGATKALTGSAPANVRQLTLPTGDLIADGVLPGDTLTVTISATPANIALASYIVTQVVSATVLEVATDLGTTGSSNITAVIKVGATTTDRRASTAYTAATSAVLTDLELELLDLNATFVDSGVIPGDLIKMPKTPTAGVYTTYDTFTVATVVSNQRLRIVNAGKNTVTVQSELPHGATRTSPVTAVPTTATLHYQVIRALDKAGQVTALQAIPTSLANKRVSLMWPDLCVVDGVVDGSLARAVATVPTAAPALPSYYLACVVAGLSSALPSHQGLTNMGVASIASLLDSTPYFSETQISAISNSGWMVFQQDTEEALPYIVHQLTTDVSTLEFSEFSMVKNFDYVSRFMAGILQPFIGPWNVNDSTLGFIASALNTGITSLKSATRVRIGAPINSGKLVSVTASTVSKDRAVAKMQVDFPAPLNTAELHIVSG